MCQRLQTGNLCEDALEENLELRHVSYSSLEKTLNKKGGAVVGDNS